MTIAALGDSLTAGYGLPSSEGFVPQLESWLRAQGADVRVINAGVSGDTTAGGRSRVGWTLTPDVDVMIVALGGNDYLRGIDPSITRANLDAILAAGHQAEVRMLLVGLAVGANYGRDYQEDFTAIYPDLAAAYDIPLYPDFMAGLRDDGARTAELLAYMQPDGIHPNAEGVKRVVAALGPEVLALIAAE